MKFFVFSLSLFSFICRFGNANECARSENNIDHIESISCQLHQEQVCSQFYQQFKSEFKKKYGLSCDSKKNTSSTAQDLIPPISCGGLALVAAGSLVQKVFSNSKDAESLKWYQVSDVTKAKLIKAVPPRMVAAVGAIMSPLASPVLAVAGASMTTYTIYNVLDESLKNDQNCYENINLKKDAISFLHENNLKILEKHSDSINEIEKKQLMITQDYLKNDFIKNLTCQRLKEIIISQKRVQDSIYGRLIAQNKITSDPRKKQSLNKEFSEEAKLIVQNISCISEQKRMDILCQIGNITLGSIQSVKFFEDMKSLRVNKEFLDNPRISGTKLTENQISGHLGEAEKLPKSSRLNDFDVLRGGEKTKFIFVEEPGSGHRYVRTVLSRQDNAITGGVTKEGDRVAYPDFQTRMGVTISDGGQKVLRPADATTYNSYIDNYNKNRVKSEQISVRVADDYSRSGWTSEEMVRNWSKDGLVPLNQVNSVLFKHDNEIHIEQYQLLPNEVVSRSRHNFAEVLNLLETSNFSHKKSLKAIILNDMGELLDRSSVAFTANTTISGTQKNWNSLILDPNELRQRFLKIEPLSNSQINLLDKALKRFKKPLTEQELNIEYNIIQRRSNRAN